MIHELEQIYREQVSQFFDRAVGAVRDVEQPIPEEFFDSPISGDGCPAFDVMDPKRLGSVIDELSHVGIVGAEDLERNLLIPLVDRWTGLIQALRERFRGAPEVSELRDKLEMYFGLVKDVAVRHLRGVAVGYPVIDYNKYCELKRAYTRIGDLVRQGASDDAETEVVHTPRRQSRGYPSDLECTRALDDLLRIKQEHRAQRMTSAQAIEQYLETGYYKDRLWYGAERNGRRELQRPDTKDHILRNWGAYMSAYKNRNRR